MNTDSPVIAALGWTLVHFLWQAAFVACLLWLVLRLLRQRPAAWRYAAAGGALLLMPLSAGLTCALVWHPRPVADAPPAAAGKSVSAIPPALPQPVAGFPEPAAAPAGAPLPLAAARPLPDLPPAAGESRTLSLEPALPWIVSLWGLGVAGFSLRLALGWRAARRLCRTGTRVADSVWESRCAGLARALGLRRPVRLLASLQSRVPMVIGWVKPVILVPAGLFSGMSVPHLEAILAHELAHIRRHDYLFNLCQHAVETLFFYHPAVWWVSARLRHEREFCADDVAARLCGDPVRYARALATLEELRADGLQLGLAASSRPLLQRVRRLLSLPDETRRTPAWPVLLTLAIVAAALLGIPSLTAAPPAPANDPAAESASPTDDWQAASMATSRKSSQAHQALREGRLEDAQRGFLEVRALLQEQRRRFPDSPVEVSKELDQCDQILRGLVRKLATFRGLRIGDLPRAESARAVPDLSEPDPETPGWVRPRAGVYQLDAGGSGAGPWVRGRVGSGRFYLEFGDTIVGPVEGNPVAMLHLDTLWRDGVRTSPDHTLAALRTLLTCGDAALAASAWPLLSDLPEPRPHDAYAALTAAAEARLAAQPDANGTAALARVKALTAATTARRESLRIRIPEDAYAPGLTNADLPADIRWMAPRADGICLGVAGLRPDGQVILGQKLALTFYLRNDSRETIRIGYTDSPDEGLRYSFTGTDGNRSRPESVIAADAAILRTRLVPGGIAAVKSVNIEVIPPGTLRWPSNPQVTRVLVEFPMLPPAPRKPAIVPVSTAACTFEAELQIGSPDRDGPDGRVLLPALGEWTGTLSLSPQPLHLTVPPLPPPTRVPRHDLTARILRLWHAKFPDAASIPAETIRSTLSPDPEFVRSHGLLKARLLQFADDREWTWTEAQQKLDSLADTGTIFPLGADGYYNELRPVPGVAASILLTPAREDWQPGDVV